MSWHTPGVGVGVESRSLNPSSCHAPGPVVWTEDSPKPGLPCPASSEPQLTTCGLCPEPGLVPASSLSIHLLKEHPGEAFECAACKDGGVSVLSVNFAGIKDHVRQVHKVQEKMITSAVTCPNIPSLAAVICVNCNNNEDSRIWFTESDAYRHIDNIHGQFFRKKLLAATCRLCDKRGSLAEIQSHVVQCRMNIEFENEVSDGDIKPFSESKSSGPVLINDSKVLIRKDIHENSNPTAKVIKEEHDETKSIENVRKKRTKRKSTEEKREDGEPVSSKQIDKSAPPSPLSSKMIRVSLRSSSCSSSGVSSSDSLRKESKSKETHKRSGTPRRESSSKCSQDRKSSFKSHVEKHIKLSSRSESRSEDRFETKSSLLPVSERSHGYSGESRSKSPPSCINIIQGSPSPQYRSPPRAYRHRGRSPPRYRSYSRSRSRSPRYWRSRSRSPRHYQPFSPYDLRHSIRHKQTGPRNTLHRDRTSPQRSRTKNGIVSSGYHYTKYENGESQCNTCGVISQTQIQYKEHLTSEKHKNAMKQIANEILRKHGGRSRSKSKDRSGDDSENVNGEMRKAKSLFCDICQIWCNHPEAFYLHLGGKAHASRLGPKALENNRAINAQAAKISAKNAPLPTVVRRAAFGQQLCSKCHKTTSGNHYHCEICKICCLDPRTYEQHIAGKIHAANVQQEKSKDSEKSPKNLEISSRKSLPLPPKPASSSISQSIASSPSKPTSDLLCHGCDEKFGSIQSLTRHIHNVHGFIIKCSKCEEKGQAPAEVLTCKALIVHYLEAHNKAIKDYDLKLYGTVNNWKQGYVRCKLCSMRLGGPGLWFTNSLDKTVMRAHFKTYHDNLASNVKPLSQVVLGCQLCTISDFSSSSTFSWQTHLATHSKRNTDVSEESTSQTESTWASNLVTGPCSYCGDKVVKTGNADQMHVRNKHLELSFRCKMCKGKQTCYERLEDVERHLEERHGWHSDIGKIKAVQVHMPGDKGDLLGFAWVRCKRLGCGFTGIGMKAETLRHQAKDHIGGGIKYFNIFCRICVSSKKVDKSTEVFDDASDFSNHMRQCHQELVELLPDSQ